MCCVVAEGRSELYSGTGATHCNAKHASKSLSATRFRSKALEEALLHTCRPISTVHRNSRIKIRRCDMYINML